MKLEVKPLSPLFIDQAMNLMKRFEETSLFLLGNMRSFGTTLGEHPSSGNFYCLSDRGRVVAVFCPTRRGNIILQTDRTRDYSDEIITACLNEAHIPRGVLGDWDLAEPVWRTLREKCPSLQDKYVSKEILFRLELKQDIQESHMEGTRLLHPEDFPSWEPFNRAYLEEEGLPQDRTPAQVRDGFLHSVHEKTLWGCFMGSQLVSVAAFNTKFEDIGQVGGVFTPRSERRKGYSKRCMNRLISDSHTKLGLRKLILFTGEKNNAAQALYDGLGFMRIGHFGMLIGEVIE